MLKPFNFKVEHKKNPLGIDCQRLVLGWQLKGEEGDKQKAYQIQVASTVKLLETDRPDFWDSGKVSSGRSINIEYSGEELQSNTCYYWRVRVWNECDRVSQWSRVNSWEMGLLKPSDWQGEWIGQKNWQDEPEPEPASYFRKIFSLEKKVKRARIFISGLGYYQLYLNGKNVGGRVLDPGQTDYEETVLYATYDVTGMLNNENTVGVALGRGRYYMTTPNTWGWHKPPWRDQPKLLFQLEVNFIDDTTRTIVSDDTWKTTSGPTIFDSLYEGEIYDARLEKSGWTGIGFDDQNWEEVVIVKKPQGSLRSQLLEPIKIRDKIKADKINKLGKGHYVLDFAQMIAGWVELNVSGEAGTEVILIYGEKLNDDGTIDMNQNHIADKDIQVDKYILKGNCFESWEPAFSYKGFRYLEVKGYPGSLKPENIIGKIIHTSVEPVGKFTSSSQLFNQIHRNTCWSILNNLHSIPTDTPVFEKNGWTGDAQLTAEAAMYNFNMTGFYIKWMNDFKDSQLDDGELPPIVPTSDWGYTDTPYGWEDMDGVVPAWDSAYILIPWWFYEFYGDERILKKHYNGMKLYLDYLKSFSSNYIVREGLGDWLEPTGEGEKWEGKPPQEAHLTSTAYFYQDTKILAAIAGVLGYEEDKEKYSELMKEIYSSFNRTFFSKDKYIYESNSDYRYRQTSNVVPLAFGLVPEEYKEAVLKNLVQNIEEDCAGHLNTGIIGTKYILNVLTENGYVDTAYMIANQTTYPSWGYWIENGATSLYEAWELGARSRNHHMYGTVDDWFYKSLAGIRPLLPGYEKVSIRPYLPGELTEVKAEYNSIRGKISSSWKKVKKTVVLNLDIPTGVEAEVDIPVSDKIDRKVQLIDNDNGQVSLVNNDNCYARVCIQSGTYRFTSDFNKGEIIKKRELD